MADGIVVLCGWVEGFGKQVAMRHPDGYVSYYSHLSRYGPGMKKGIRIEQKQIIGYVGTTGFTTGPHLDFRLSKNDQFINPLKGVFPFGQPIDKKNMEAFQKRRDEAMGWLNSDHPIRIMLGEIISA